MGLLLRACPRFGDGIARLHALFKDFRGFIRREVSFPLSLKLSLLTYEMSFAFALKVLGDSVKESLSDLPC